MKTYLHAPQCPQNELEEILSARNDIRHALRSSRNSRGCLENLFGMLRPFFPVSFLLITEPRDIEEQRRLHVYPQVGGRDILSGTYEREYLRAAAAVSHGPMVRIGNQDDHAITIALLRNSLPRRRFSILFFRNTFADGKFAVFGIVAQGEGRFQEIHCARMFALVDLFSEYWKSGRGGKKTAARRHDPGYLELENLPGMQKTLHMLWMAGRQDFPVLLLGETGTGKEVAANIVHRCSARHGGAFVKMNCGNIPENLVDSELFGHEKGAFTGADAMHRGRFERADRGVLLLDELGELPLTAQARLLRVLQERCFERLGGTESLSVDVRIITATNRDLARMVEEGTFRRDLYYRLNVFPIHMPPLRERQNDIQPLAAYFVDKYAAANGRSGIRISLAVMDMLQRYTWPGNIRELENVMERAVLLVGQDGLILPQHLPRELHSTHCPFGPAAHKGPVEPYAASGTLQDRLDELERACITDALARHKGHMGHAAQALGLTERVMALRRNMASITRISASIDAGGRQKGEPELSLCAAVFSLVGESMKKARQSMTPAGLMHKGALRAFPALRYAPGEIRPVFPKRKDRGGKGRLHRGQRALPRLIVTTAVPANVPGLRWYPPHCRRR